MNINQTRQIRTAALASAIVVVVTMVASPATAQHSRSDHSPARTSEPAPLGYATQLAALDGRTLAQYVQEHQQKDVRTFTGV